MTNLVIDEKLHILSVNQENFVFHPSKLVSFTLNVLLNKQFIMFFRFLNEPKLFEEAIEFVSHSFNSEENISEYILNSMIDKGFIRKCDNTYKNEMMWKDSNWNEALSFHLHTNNLPKMMYNTEQGEKDDIHLMEEYVKDAVIPPNYKSCSGKHIFLAKPSIDKTHKVSRLLDPGINALDMNISTLSRLLYYAFGQIGTRNMRVTGEHIRKTIPSGGARHPIEAYLIISDIPDISVGIYHYNVKEHALTLVQSLQKEEAKKIIQNNILLDENRPGFSYCMAIVYSCVFERSMFRYREARSYRVMHYDMGHITQNLSFLARAYGLNLYCGYSCNEKEIENIIGLDNLLESIISYSVM
jgi:SagB-type dehydrogenase family enzyme